MHLLPGWVHRPVALLISQACPYRDIGPEEVVVAQQATHVLHAALLLHAVSYVGLEEGAELAQGGTGTPGYLCYLWAGPCTSSSVLHFCDHPSGWQTSLALFST